MSESFVLNPSKGCLYNLLSYCLSVFFEMTTNMLHEILKEILHTQKNSFSLQFLSTQIILFANEIFILDQQHIV